MQKQKIEIGSKKENMSFPWMRRNYQSEIQFFAVK